MAYQTFVRSVEWQHTPWNIFSTVKAIRHNSQCKTCGPQSQTSSTWITDDRRWPAGLSQQLVLITVMVSEGKSQWHLTCTQCNIKHRTQQQEQLTSCWVSLPCTVSVWAAEGRAHNGADSVTAAATTAVTVPQSTTNKPHNHIQLNQHEINSFPSSFHNMLEVTRGNQKYT